MGHAPIVLTEGSVIERLRRDPWVQLHPRLLHAAFIYEEKAGAALAALYRQYMDIGKRYNLPLLSYTPTWRADKDRLTESGYYFPGGSVPEKDVNGDSGSFLAGIREEYGEYSRSIFIGGLIGCRGDAYKPEETLSTGEAESYHRFQLDRLARSGVDFLIAQTLPALPEAVGIALTMAVYDMPYVISFIVDSEGELLDGTPLEAAITRIDREVTPNPDFYMVNCVHPSRFSSAMSRVLEREESVTRRLVGLQANTSCKSPEELEGLPYLDSEEPEAFGKSMVEMVQRFGVKILGGCCGSDHRHIEAIAKNMEDEGMGRGGKKR
jgi:homocysteine S-methyltransferase